MDTNTTTPTPKQPSLLIRVRNLPFTTTDEEFTNLFAGLNIKSATVARRKDKSKGFGFVTLNSEKDQNEIIEKINQMELNNRKLIGSIAYELKNSETIAYVSNIPWSFKDEDLRNLFPKDVNIKTSMVVSSKSGRSRGYGFVEFATAEDLANGVKLDQSKVEERVITVRASKNDNVFERLVRKTTKDSKPVNKNTVSITSNNKVIQVTKPVVEYTLYVTNLPFELDDNDLKQIFHEFNVKTAKIPVRRNGKSKGFGFVEFFNAKDQNDALKALDQSEINGRLVSVNVAQKPRQRGGVRVNRSSPKSSSRSTSKPTTSSPKSPRPSNRSKSTKEVSQTIIHVSNLPYSVDDEQLASLFSQYKIVKAYIVKTTTGSSAGHGFVEFESAEEQQRALENRKGSEIQGRKFFLSSAWK